MITIKRLKQLHTLLKKHFQKYLIKRGISSGEKAYTGPGIVQLDIMDACINKCITCWTHSPFLDKKYTSQFKGHMKLEDIVLRVKMLKNIGSREIHLAGAGEPLLHPHIHDILRVIKQAGLKIHLNTALYPLPQNLAQTLVDLEVDRLTISLWAGDSLTWQKTHPGVDPAHFSKIENFLMDLANLKRKALKHLPVTKHYHVISKPNKTSLLEMMDLAIRTQAEEIEFTVTDTLKGLEHLSLDTRDIEIIEHQFQAFYKLTGYTDEFIGHGNKLDLKTLDIHNEQKEFGRFYHALPAGFARDQHHTVTCPQNLPHRQKSWIQNLPHPRFNYEFDHHMCRDCQFNSSCYVTPTSVPITTGVTNLLGAGSFLRRVHQSGTHQKGDPIVNTIPCTIGWQFARILSEGTVVPCCKAAKHPLGNLKQDNLTSVWNNQAYKEFRRNALIPDKERPYFNNIRCSEGCDNLGMNLNAIHDKLIHIEQLTQR